MFGLESLFGGDPGIYQTVQKAKQLVYYSLREPNQLVRRRAESLLRVVGRVSDGEDVKTIFEWVRSRFRYAKDPRGIEMVKSPEYVDTEISSTGAFVGDCDDVSTYLAALYKSIGFAVRFVIISPQGTPDNSYKHIYIEVFVNGLGWLPVDATNRKNIGFHIPAQRKDTFDV